MSDGHRGVKQALHSRLQPDHPAEKSLSVEATEVATPPDSPDRRYGFATRADLLFALRAERPNLPGLKEFGGAADLRCAAENITRSR